jgi:hypothetical protein
MFGVPRQEVRARLSGSESNCRIASTAWIALAIAAGVASHPYESE